MQFLINKKLLLIALIMLAGTTLISAQEKPNENRLVKKISVSEKQSCNSAKTISNEKKECNYDKAKCETYKKSGHKKLSNKDCDRESCNSEKVKMSENTTQVKVLETVNKKHECNNECKSNCEVKS